MKHIHVKQQVLILAWNTYLKYKLKYDDIITRFTFTFTSKLKKKEKKKLVF